MHLDVVILDFDLAKVLDPPEFSSKADQTDEKEMSNREKKRRERLAEFWGQEQKLPEEETQRLENLFQRGMQLDA